MIIPPGDGLIQEAELQHVMQACMEENGMSFDEEAVEELTRALGDTAVPSIVSLADCQPRQTIGLVRLDCCGPGLTPTVVSEPPDAAGDCSQAATTEGLPESSAR